MKKFLIGLFILSGILTSGVASAKLYDFYNTHLPTIDERKPIAESCGIQNYTGTAIQNNQLESCLNKSGDALLGGTTTLMPNQGGTGTSTRPNSGSILLGNASGTYNVVDYTSLPFITAEDDPIFVGAYGTFTTTSFASPNVSQWTNDIGYITSTIEVDPLWSAVSTSVPYLSSANTFTNINAFTNTTNLTSASFSGHVTTTQLSINGTNGLLKSTAGQIGSATSGVDYVASELDPIWAAASTSYGNKSLANTWTGINTFNNAINGTTANFSGIVTSSDIFLSLLNNSLVNEFSLVGEPTGFPNTTDSVLSFNNGTRTFTISPAVSSYDYYVKGVKFTTTTPISTVVPSTAGQTTLIYFNSNGLIATTTDPLVFIRDGAQIASLYWDTTEGVIGYERHPVTMDWATHYYNHTTRGTQYVSGLTGVFSSANTFTMTSGVIADEDNIDNVPSTTTARIFYRTGGTSVFNFTAKSTPWFYVSGGNVYYDNAGNITAANSNSYVAYWIFATNDRTNPIYILMGQREDNTLANAQANNLYSSLSLGNMPFQEMKLLYRVIVRNNSPTFTVAATDDYRSSPITGTTAISTQHNTLTGLDYATAGHTGFAGTGVENTFTTTNTFSSGLIGYLTGTSTQTLSDNTWTLHNSYPSACSAGQFVTAIGDTLTCSAAIITESDPIWTSASTSYAKLSSNNVFTGSNTFGVTTTFNTIPYYWPASQTSGVLTNNGSGTLTWSSAGAGDAILSANQTFTGLNTFSATTTFATATFSGRIGIGTTTPISRLTVNGDITFSSSTQGVVLTSPDGTWWRLQIDNNGILTATGSSTSQITLGSASNQDNFDFQIESYFKRLSIWDKIVLFFKSLFI